MKRWAAIAGIFSMIFAVKVWGTISGAFHLTGAIIGSLSMTTFLIYKLLAHG